MLPCPPNHFEDALKILENSISNNKIFYYLLSAGSCIWPGLLDPCRFPEAEELA